MVPVEAAPLVSVAIDQLISASEWRVLLEAVQICADHQGLVVGLPLLSEIVGSPTFTKIQSYSGVPESMSLDWTGIPGASLPTGATPGAWFDITSTTTTYRCWFFDTSTTPPAVTTETLIAIPFTGAETGQAISDLVVTAIVTTTGDADFAGFDNAGGTTRLVTGTLVKTGDVTDPVDGAEPTGAIISSTTQGSGPVKTGSFPTSVAAIRVDPTAVGSGSTSLISPALTDTRGAAWSNQLTHIFQQSFTSGDAARQWFNSGGQIRIRATRTGGAGTTQDLAWDFVLAAMGTVIFDFDDTTNTGATSLPTTLGYYDMTTSFQTIFSITNAQAGGGGAYSANRIIIQARSVLGPTGPDDKGLQLEFRIDYQDIHVSGGFFDQVSGTFRSFVDLREGDVFLTDPDPSTFRTGLPVTTTSIATGT
jgi:hypothetical protein